MTDSGDYVAAELFVNSSLVAISSQDVYIEDEDDAEAWAANSLASLLSMVAAL